MGRINTTAGGVVVGQYAVAVTPSDSNNLDTATGKPFRIWVGGAGVVTCVPARGQATVAFTMNAGSTVPVAVRKVLATGTTATLMVAYY